MSPTKSDKRNAEVKILQAKLAYYTNFIEKHKQVGKNTASTKLITSNVAKVTKPSHTFRNKELCNQVPLSQSSSKNIIILKSRPSSSSSNKIELLNVKIQNNLNPAVKNSTHGSEKMAHTKSLPQNNNLVNNTSKSGHIPSKKELLNEMDDVIMRLKQKLLEKSTSLKNNSTVAAKLKQNSLPKKIHCVKDQNSNRANKILNKYSVTNTGYQLKNIVAAPKKPNLSKHFVKTAVRLPNQTALSLSTPKSFSKVAHNSKPNSSRKKREVSKFKVVNKNTPKCAAKLVKTQSGRKSPSSKLSLRRKSPLAKCGNAGEFLKTQLQSVKKTKEVISKYKIVNRSSKTLHGIDNRCKMKKLGEPVLSKPAIILPRTTKKNETAGRCKTSSSSKYKLVIGEKTNTSQITSHSFKSLQQTTNKYKIKTPNFKKSFNSNHRRTSIRSTFANRTLLQQFSKRNTPKVFQGRYKIVKHVSSVNRKKNRKNSGSFQLTSIESEDDPDIAKEYAAIQKNLFFNFVRTPPKLVKRVLKTKTRIVNRNTDSIKTRTAKMIKSKYFTPSKRSPVMKMLNPGLKFDRKMLSSNQWSGTKRIFKKYHINTMNQKNVKKMVYVSYNKTLKRTSIQRKSGSFKGITASPIVQQLANRVLHRSINKVLNTTVKKKLSKRNVYCLFYNRFGRCNKGTDCSYVHDPSKIAVCTRYLRGTCKLTNCPFSHEICPGKMALCSYFLLDCCTKLDCPYRHEKLSPNAELCKNFVKGYCNKGKECKKAHVLVCPKYIQGTCEKGNLCAFPHPPPKEKKQEFSAKYNAEVPKITDDLLVEKMERYFGSHLQSDLPDTPLVKAIVPKRQALEEQPSFIALSFTSPGN